MARYIEIPILASARRVGLHVKERTIGNVEVEALCPFCGDCKYHLFLNTRKDTFYCQYCKASGNSVTLYARLMNVDNKTAYKELTEGNFYALRPEPPPKPNDEQEPKPLHIRHDVYYDFLQLLALEDKHLQNLKKRGLSEERIERNMYRSVPMDRAASVLSKLSEHYDLMGIPGFYTQDGRWRMYQRHGFFVPICTAEGYIQGLQIRLDGEEHRKYRWFSSRYMENGTRAYPWIHITGNMKDKTACVTEGALKADVASLLSKDTMFVSVPGINCLGGLPEVLKTLNIAKVVETFDMDKLENPHVAQAVAEIQKIVQSLGLDYVLYTWNPLFKGIDDYLLSRVAA